MTKIICPHCHEEIETETYYSRHRTKLLKIYKERMQDPEFVDYRRKVALKAYYKKKGK